MLTLDAKIYFDTKLENSDALDNDLDTKKIIRPAINFGDGLLFSGSVKVNESTTMIKRGESYEVTVNFPTIENEAYGAIRSFLCPNAVFKIQVSSKVIGKCTMLEYSYE